MQMKTNNHRRAFLPQLLLISGSGRNCGKTTLACEIIKSVSEKSQLFALKISPHFHKLNEKQELLFESRAFKIFQETDLKTGKDSSRMLQAGATNSYYIQCEDQHIHSAWECMKEILPANFPVICESGSLANIFKPGIHLLVEGINPDRMKRSFMRNRELADQIIQFNGSRFNINVSKIAFENGGWTLKENQNDQVRRSA